MREVRINDPEAGPWIMGQLGAAFMPRFDNSFSTWLDGKLLGGFVLTWYLRGSITCHMAAQDKRWFTRELAWLMFHYAFKQLGVYKMLTPLASDEHRIIAMDMRAGWNLEA